jgi:hypothetical protein
MNRVAEGKRMADAQNHEMLQKTAMQWLVSPPDARPMARHIEVIWANFCDAFTDRAEFDAAVSKKLRRIEKTLDVIPQPATSM